MFFNTQISIINIKQTVISRISASQGALHARQIAVRHDRPQQRTQRPSSTNVEHVVREQNRLPFIGAVRARVYCIARAVHCRVEGAIQRGCPEVAQMIGAHG